MCEGVKGGTCHALNDAQLTHPDLFAGVVVEITQLAPAEAVNVHDGLEDSVDAGEAVVSRDAAWDEFPVGHVVEDAGEEETEHFGDGADSVGGEGLCSCEEA